MNEEDILSSSTDTLLVKSIDSNDEYNAGPSSGRRNPGKQKVNQDQVGYVSSSQYKKFHKTAIDYLLPQLPKTVYEVNTTTPEDHETKSKSDLIDKYDDRTPFVSVEIIDSCSQGTCCCPAPGLKSLFSSSWWFNYIIGAKFIKSKNIISSYFVSFYVILVVRLIISTYATFTLVGSLVDGIQQGYWFVYFTHLSFLGLNIYFWFALFYSFKHLFFPEEDDVIRVPHIGECLTCILYCFSFCFHIIVPVVFWAFLGTNWNWYNNEPTDRWLNVTQHGIDFLLIFIELFLNKIVYVWGNLVLMIITMVFYICYTWMFAHFYPTKGPYHNGFPYFFVNYNEPITGAWIIGMTGLFVFVWAVAVFLHCMRAKIGNWIENVRLANM